jgi:tol-pal system protein YbgF
MIDRLFCLPRTLGLALAASIALGSTAAFAQSSADLIYLQDRVERLEAMVQIYGSASGPPDGDPTSAAAGSQRIAAVEEQVRHLTGQVEQMAHVLRQIESRIGRVSDEPQFRLRERDEAAEGGEGSWQTERLIDHGVDVPSEAGTGEPPRILGQVPGQPLDLTGSLELPGGFGRPIDESTLERTVDDQFAALPLSGNPRDDYDTAYGYILRGEFAAAEQGFRQFLTHYPDDDLAGNAQYWLGESLFARARYRDAADAFLAGYTEHPESAKAPDSLFKLGLSLKELGQRDAACATLVEIGRRYPNAPQAVRERARSEMDKSGC